MSLDIFNQCYNLAIAMQRGCGRIPVSQPVTITRQLRVDITSDDYDALCAAMPTWQMHYNQPAPEGPIYSVNIMGVQFRRSDASWIAQLHESILKLQVENAHLRGLLYRENHTAVDTPKPAGRRALDCDNAAPGEEVGPGTNGGRPA